MSTDQEPREGEGEGEVQYSACDAELFIFKDLQQHMAHPFFSLSKRPCLKEIKYESGRDWLKIQPSVKGRATIYDKDILVYIISQLIQKDKDEEEISRHVSINPQDLLTSTNRGVGGRDYKMLVDALDRLVGTRIQTNIVQGGQVELSAYGMIDGYRVLKKDDKIDSRMTGLEVSLSKQLYNSMNTKKELLTVNPDYFQLSKPIEKKIYEIARKHAGKKERYVMNVSTLLQKSGSVGNIRDFRRALKKLIETHAAQRTFPDYDVHFDTDKDQVAFFQKQTWWAKSTVDPNFNFPAFKTTVYEDAKLVAPNDCVYNLYEQFKDWVMKTPEKFNFEHDAIATTYLNFCKMKHKKNNK